MSNLDFDFLSPTDLLAANPGGIPQAVSMPGAQPFTLTPPSGTYPGPVTPPGSAPAISTGNTNAAFSGPPAGTTASAPVTTNMATPTTAAASVGPVPGSISDYFARGIIVILGMIFVAVGLNMLKPGLIPIPSPAKLVK
jgi:hypothetical protein